MSTAGRAVAWNQWPIGRRAQRWKAQSRPTVTVSRTAARALLASATRNATTAAPINVHLATGVRPGAFSPSSCMKSEQIVGLTTSATNSDALSVMIRVSGRYFMNSPMMPGQNAIGAKAARVVAVAAITGLATSAVPYFAADGRSWPCSMKR